MSAQNGTSQNWDKMAAFSFIAEVN